MNIEGREINMTAKAKEMGFPLKLTYGNIALEILWISLKEAGARLLPFRAGKQQIYGVWSLDTFLNVL